MPLPAVLHECGEVDTIVPVRCEVFNFAVREHSLKKSNFVN
jgi:hypothetical protein